MDNRVSDKRLAEMHLFAGDRVDRKDEFVWIHAKDLRDALRELRDRRAAEREQAEPRLPKVGYHDVDRFYLENTDCRIEDIEALDETGYNWNLIHGVGLCGTERTPFEGWRCILSATGLEMAGYDGATMHEAISAALSALAACEQSALDAASDEALANTDKVIGAWPESAATTCAPKVTVGDPVKETWAETAERVLRDREGTWRKLAEMDAGEMTELQAVPEETKLRNQVVILRGQLEALALRVEALEERETTHDPEDDEYADTHPAEPGDWVERLRDQWANDAAAYDRAGYQHDADLVRYLIGALYDAHAAHKAETPKWERQLNEMAAKLLPPCYASSPLWHCVVGHGLNGRDYSGDTPQAAIAAAYKAWREARDGRSGE